MGKALYRKYRSKTLDEVVGQKHITDTLSNALKKGAISHAYLFTGPRGVGKTSIARILAHEINNLDYTDEATHLDIIEIDAASNRRIDEIRDLRDKVHISPAAAKYKVYIIDEVHMLTREAFNALLKTLEEPPEHAVFILATTEAHKVPDTILSRTQRFTFKPVGGEDAAAHLRSIADKESITIDDESLKLLVEHGQGSFRDSISMMDQLSGMGKDSYTAEDVRELLGIPPHSIINDLLEAVSNNDRGKLFEYIQKLKVQGVDASRTVKALSARLRETIIENDLVLDYAITISLLERLLEESVHNDFLRLELALLSVMQEPNGKPIQKVTQPDSAPLAEKTQLKQETIQKPEVPTATEVKSFSGNDKAAKTTDEPEEAPSQGQETTATFSDENWQAMLNDVKAKHNTLYGVLRMAKPRVGENGLELVFGFGFHKKQLETDKNRPIVRSYLNKYLGSNEFSAVVKKAANNPVDKPAEKPVENQNIENIDNVSNIFGSAELLES